MEIDIEEAIAASVSQIVKEKIETTIQDVISDQLKSIDITVAINKTIRKLVDEKVAAVVPQMVYNRIQESNIENSAELHTRDIVAKRVVNSIDHEVRTSLSKLDMTTLIEKRVTKDLAEKIKTFTFPKASIQAAAIDWEASHIHMKDLLQTGEFKSFSSTGILDRAKTKQLTILNSGIVATHGQFDGGLVVKGDLSVSGEINRDSKFYLSLVESINNMGKDIENEVDKKFDSFGASFNENGLDVQKLTFHDKPLIQNGSLNYRVTDSNLQGVGILKELQVGGESLLSDTLYTTPAGRVGINTNEPSASLSVWDEETEVVIKKHSKHTGYIGTVRNTDLVLGRNSNEDMRIASDGVHLDKVHIGNTTISSSNTMPTYAGKAGDIVFNTGASFLGWKCLGSHRWVEIGLL